MALTDLLQRVARALWQSGSRANLAIERRVFKTERGGVETLESRPVEWVGRSLLARERERTVPATSASLRTFLLVAFLLLSLSCSVNSCGLAVARDNTAVELSETEATRHGWQGLVCALSTDGTNATAIVAAKRRTPAPKRRIAAAVSGLVGNSDHRQLRAVKCPLKRADHSDAIRLRMATSAFGSASALQPRVAQAMPETATHAFTGHGHDGRRPGLVGDARVVTPDVPQAIDNTQLAVMGLFLKLLLIGAATAAWPLYSYLQYVSRLGARDRGVRLRGQMCILTRKVCVAGGYILFEYEPDRRISATLWEHNDKLRRMVDDMAALAQFSPAGIFRKDAVVRGRPPKNANIFFLDLPGACPFLRIPRIPPLPRAAYFRAMW